MKLPETSRSLLGDARQSDPAAWQRVVAIYGPVLYERLRRKGLPEADAADVVQDTFLAVSQSLVDFQHRAGTGAFRSWIWVITQRKLLDHVKRRCHRIRAEGGTDANLRLLNLATEDSDDDELEGSTHHARLVQQIHRQIQDEFEPRTYQAFLLTTVEELSGAEVAERLEMSVGAVYKAKSRVLQRIRTLIDDPFDQATSSSSQDAEILI